MAEAPSPYWEVCRLLEEAGASYLVIGQCAALLHGHVRDTKDIDLLIPRDVANTRKVLEALARLPLGLAREHSAEEVSARPITILGDMPRVDLLTGVGGYNYHTALPGSLEARIGGARVLYVSLDVLIRMKERAGRPQDQADLLVLRKLRELGAGGAVGGGGAAKGE